MSPHDLAERLIRSLERTAQLLTTMERGLKARRLQWAGARPDDLLQPVLELEQCAQELRAEEDRRGGLLTQIAAALPLPAPRPDGSLRVTVGRIAPHLAAAQARRLVEAATRATGLARGVRVETAMGTRLLEFARRAHDGVLGAVAGRERGPAAYDRNARRVRGALPNATAGNLIDGRL